MLNKVVDLQYSSAALNATSNPGPRFISVLRNVFLLVILLQKLLCLLAPLEGMVSNCVCVLGDTDQGIYFSFCYKGYINNINV